MNQQQAKYTIARIDQLEARKLEELRKACTTPAKRLSSHERADLIRKGKVKLRADCTDINYHTDVVNAFDFSKHEWSERLSDDHEARAAAVKAQASRVRDEVMLGDNAEALKLLREFAGE